MQRPTFVENCAMLYLSPSNSHHRLLVILDYGFNIFMGGILLQEELWFFRTIIACVANVSNRVIGLKLKREPFHLFCSRPNFHDELRIERLQSKAMRTIWSENHLTCLQTMRDKLALLTLSRRRRFMRLQLVFEIVNNQRCPTQFHNYLTLRSECCGRT